MRTGLQPQRWKTGTDPLKHEMYRPFTQAKAQAKFRNEAWDLTFDDYYNIWKDEWQNRGRETGCKILTRVDPSKSWNASNIHLQTRIRNGDQILNLHNKR